MRSRKVSPGLEVIRILIRSERTLVPPVTALRSPPDSRMTGALSPVITDSSMVAIPSMTSPSPGMRSPVSATTTSPARSCAAVTSSTELFTNRFPTASVFVLRSVSACAFPRASAIASAKLAKSTVNQSQRAIWDSKPRCLRPRAKSRTRKAVTRAAPTSTTKMTGFFARVFGLSLTKDSRVARLTISRSNRGRARLNLGGRSELGPGELGGAALGVGISTTVAMILAPDVHHHEREEPPVLHEEVLSDGTQREGREEGQCPDQDHGS